MGLIPKMAFSSWIVLLFQVYITFTIFQFKQNFDIHLMGQLQDFPTIVLFIKNILDGINLILFKFAMDNLFNIRVQLFLFLFLRGGDNLIRFGGQSWRRGIALRGRGWGTIPEIGQGKNIKFPWPLLDIDIYGAALPIL